MCKNRVSLFTTRGKEVLIPCGLTGFHGERVICDDCLKSEDAMRAHFDAEENIRADNAWSASAGWGEW